MCGRCRVFASYGRLGLHGQEYKLHVHYRTGVIRAVTGVDVSQEELGGAMTHNSKSGVAHFAAEDDRDCIEQIRKLLSFLPSNNRSSPRELKLATSQSY